MEVRRLSLPEWEAALPGSGYEAFHRPGALSVLADHARGELELYGGFKGDRPVALVPAFVRRLPLGGRVVASPPPGMHVPHLGPIVTPASPKQRKRERVNRRFVEAVVERLVDARTLVFVLCSPGYEDPRPFEWTDLSVDVSFTYDLPVEDDPEAILRRFSRSRRREVRSGRDAPVEVTVSADDTDDARTVYDRTRERFREQGEGFGPTWPFVRDLYLALGSDARCYLARGPDDRIRGGILALYADDTVSFWLGGVRASVEGVSLNSLLHWAIVRDAAADPDLERYDMVGAGEYRLSKYKSKFNPCLRQYYAVSSGGLRMEAARTAYATLATARTRVARLAGSMLSSPSPREE